MDDPEGRVVSYDSQSTGALAVVEVQSGVACERCAAGRGCGAGLLGTQTGIRHVHAIVPDGLDIADGDRVSLVLEPGNVLQAAMIVYGLPLLGALIAAVIAYGIGLGDIFAALAALAGLGVGIFLARQRLRNVRCLRELTPMVAERLSEIAK